MCSYFFIHSFIRSFVRSLIHSFARSFLRLFIYLFIYLFIVCLFFLVYTGFTGYVQKINDVRKSESGSNYYFDVHLQVSQEDVQLIRVMTTKSDTSKHQMFRDKLHAQQPIQLNLLRVAPSGMVFMHNGTVVKDAPTISIPFQFKPTATLPVMKVANIIKQKKQGDIVTVSGTVKWDSEPKTPENTKKRVRDGKCIDSTGIIDISVWEDHIEQIQEGRFYTISNCKVKYFYGKKLSTLPETTITPAKEQDTSKSEMCKTDEKPVVCCPEIQNVMVDMYAICNFKDCKARITGNTESKVMVRCTSCNRAMLIKNCYVEITTSFQLEKENKQYNVNAYNKAITNFLKEDIFLYKDNLDKLTEKLLLLENVDFRLSNNGKIVTEITSHEQMSSPPAEEKESQQQEIQEQDNQEKHNEDKN